MRPYFHIDLACTLPPGCAYWTQVIGQWRVTGQICVSAGGGAGPDGGQHRSQGRALDELV